MRFKGPSKKVLNGYKMWYIYTQWDVTQPQKKNEILPFTAMGMDLENICLVK